MYIKVEVDGFEELKNMCWSGALHTLRKIEEADLEVDFIAYLEDVFYDDIPTDTEINDFIWFDDEMIYEALGLDNDGNVIDEEKEELEDAFGIFCSSTDCDNCKYKNCISMIECRECFEEDRKTK